MCWLNTRYKTNHLSDNISTIKNLTHYIIAFITESDYHCRVNIWRFNILLTSQTLDSNMLAALKIRHKIQRLLECGNRADDFYLALCESSAVVSLQRVCHRKSLTSLTCSPISLFWGKTVFVVREQKYIATQRDILLWRTLFLFFSIQYIRVKISFIVKNSVRMLS